MMPGSKGQKAVHACMIRLLNLEAAKHEEVVICIANQRIPNVCRIAGAACCGAIRRHLGIVGTCLREVKSHGRRSQNIGT